MRIFKGVGLGLTLVGLAGCGPRLTDSGVLNYASTGYDKRLYDQPPKILGSLRGVDVVVEYKCSDICPNHTVRIIRFELPNGMNCNEAGGRYTYFELPPFSMQPEGGYCVPAVLLDNWDQYVK
ncbi:hypothetical protein [Stenotrophomonas sp. PS02297]|uniref:hypothetical protein n=1 Tax=Stenotrophomonas sp. PS02297 TaxID=2991423 RepID=UPI00249BDA09|nr:hypothetical protein [Stenotrophomonas sp. PS02297]